MKSIAIIGGGPAGLSAACALSDCGFSPTLFEAGNPLQHRLHNEARHLGRGVGGAGLFSDGKFSFYPSGSKLYELGNRPRLKRAYYWCASLLRDSGIGVEPFPETIEPQSRPAHGVKDYPAHYANLAQRRRVIEQLSRLASDHILTNTSITGLEGSDTGYLLSTTGNSCAHTADALVLATGRFGSDQMARTDPHWKLPMRNLRYELGIRIEARNELGFLHRMNAPDVKRIRVVDEAEIRTFCTCRHGEVWSIPYRDFSALSGRSDGPPTEYSNFGFLVRFEHSLFGEGDAAWQHLLRHGLRTPWATVEPIAEFLSGTAKPYRSPIKPGTRPWYPSSAFQFGRIHQRLNQETFERLQKATLDLLEWAPDLLHQETVCLFPAIEGIGKYPDVDADLRIAGERIWCCGDVVGNFRGLVPSLVSGYYAGLSVANEHLASRRQPSSIAKSPSEKAILLG